MDFIRAITGHEDFLEIIEIKRGWSVDRKFYVRTTTEPLLLRVAPLSYLERRVQEFEILTKLSELNINCSQPRNFGTLPEFDVCYSLLTWVDGKDASEVLPTLPETLQYTLGLQAGTAFTQIQRTIPVPDDLPNWQRKFNAKVQRNIGMYRDSKISSPYGEEIIAHLEQHKSVLQGRPQSFHHGDFHVGNIVINDSHEVGIIDFNRWDYGDPWEEFNRLIWSVRVSTPFAQGLLNGYFNHNIPQQFWPILKYYLYTMLIGSVPYSLPFGREDSQTALENITIAYNWYRDNTDIPYWYKKEQI